MNRILYLHGFASSPASSKARFLGDRLTRIPSGGTYLSTGITTDVAIHEGQKLVLGKVRIGLDDSVDIFLVLTVKVQ